MNVIETAELFLLWTDTAEQFGFSVG